MIVLCALLALICLSSSHAKESTVVALSCGGTAKVYVKREEGKREPISQLNVVGLFRTSSTRVYLPEAA
jgi:hypothetical protein